MKGDFDTKKWLEYIRHNDKSDIIDALDNVLFSATIHYMEPCNGCPSDDNVNDVLCVRDLLNTLKECTRQQFD